MSYTGKPVAEGTSVADGVVVVTYPQPTVQPLVTLTGSETVSTTVTLTPTNENVTAESYVFTEAPTGATLSDGGRTLTVPGEGTWKTNGTTLTFTPNDGYEGQPTPVRYTGTSTSLAITLVPGTAVAFYTPVIKPWALPALVEAAPSIGASVTQPVSVDGIEPGSYTFTDGSTSLTVPGEGTWTITTGPDAITFEPQTGFRATPTPVE